MQISIGLPATIPGVEGKFMLDWAQKADSGPFESLGIIGRLAYSNYDPLITLAAAAGATQRIRLMTAALIAPLQRSGVLAKQTASLDALSGGRLTLGLGVGNREDDYKAAPTSFKERGKHFDEQLAIMKRVWAGEPLSAEVGPLGPPPVQRGGPPLLIGGRSRPAFQRVATWGAGYISSESNVQAARQNYQKAKACWNTEGRPGKPRFVGITYFGLGPHAREQINSYLLQYYAFRGPAAEEVANAAADTPKKLKEAIQAYTDIGMDELMFWPCLPQLDQIDQLADLIS
jgi:alkanesulfonate monooxygenase SsuD/methylene tetrahydromethanopterin reductase-like flavin-dependent oxidoreductase (luciferase family)